MKPSFSLPLKGGIPVSIPFSSRNPCSELAELRCSRVGFLWQIAKFTSSVHHHRTDSTASQSLPKGSRCRHRRWAYRALGPFANHNSLCCFYCYQWRSRLLFHRGLASYRVQPHERHPPLLSSPRCFWSRAKCSGVTVVQCVKNTAREVKANETVDPLTENVPRLMCARQRQH